MSVSQISGLNEQRVISEQCFVKNVPKEILLHIFSMMNFRDLMSCSRVDREWNKLSNNDSIWKVVYKNMYGEDLPFLHESARTQTLNRQFCLTGFYLSQGKYALRKVVSFDEKAVDRSTKILLNYDTNFNRASKITSQKKTYTFDAFDIEKNTSFNFVKANASEKVKFQLCANTLFTKEGMVLQVYDLEKKELFRIDNCFVDVPCNNGRYVFVIKENTPQLCELYDVSTGVRINVIPRLNGVLSDHNKVLDHHSGNKRVLYLRNLGQMYSYDVQIYDSNNGVVASRVVSMKYTKIFENAD